MTKKDEKEQEKRHDKYIDQSDNSTTRIAIATTCCGGYHQTIAGALLKSEEWGEWYNHASRNMLFDVDETQTIDAMSDGHFNSFISFIKQSARLEALEEVERIKKLLADLLSDVMIAKFGTKNRSELITRLQEIYLLLSKHHE